MSPYRLIKYFLNLLLDISCFGSKMIKMFQGESVYGLSNPFQAFRGNIYTPFLGASCPTLSARTPQEDIRACGLMAR
ncbi:MAG: hypothetical protein AABY49_04475, partial [Planctomycetota bacterium]